MFYNVVDVTLYLIFICMHFLVLKNTHSTELYNMSDYQLPMNTMLMFIFIIVNKVSTHKILSLTGIFTYHLSPSYYIIGILFKNERTHSHGSSSPIQFKTLPFVSPTNDETCGKSSLNMVTIKLEKAQ